MTRGSIAFDIDGTITRRNGAISVRMTQLFHKLMREGWRLAVITGQTLDNIQPRVLDLIRASAMKAFDLRVYSCEGARHWSFGLDGPSPVSAVDWFTQCERDELSAAATAMLADLSFAGGLKVLQRPAWWEESLLIFKVRPGTLNREALSREIAARLDAARLGLRVGAAGRTTVVVTRSPVHKGSALSELRQDTPADKPVWFLADEFAAPGNDNVALDIRGVLCVSVGRPMTDSRILVEPGFGARGTFRFLSILARLTAESAGNIAPRALAAASQRGTSR